MKNDDIADRTRAGARRYEIRFEGSLDRRWTAWFDGLTITVTDEGTFLTGSVADQAALFGLLRKVRDLGLPLLSLRCLGEQDPD